MEIIDGARDYEYFKSIWEYKKSTGFHHTAKKWDGRAEDWAKELADNSSFQDSINERVSKAAGYLRGHGLLGAGSKVIDIGCGPGRFTAEFAKTAGHVTGVDLSPRMLELAADYAKTQGIENVSYLAGDFMEMDLDQLGWNQHFDLVFTSITPAIGTMESLKKAMSISRGYCFNSCFIHWEDELEEQISKAVYGREYKPSQDTHGCWYYSLFNLLWLEGYFPETHYHMYDQQVETVINEDLARYYARTFSGDMTADEKETQKIYSYLKELAAGNKTIKQRTKRWYGWLLWDVRKRHNRISQGEG